CRSCRYRGSTYPPSVFFFQAEDGIREKPEPGGDNCAGGIPRNPASGKSEAGTQCFSSGRARRKRGPATVDLATSTHARMQFWPLPLVITSALVVGGLVYLRGWLCLRKAVPNLVAGWRLAAFMSGLSLAWTAVASPLATLDHQSLTIHMMKHLLLMTVVAPL